MMKTINYYIIATVFTMLGQAMAMENSKGDISGKIIVLQNTWKIDPGESNGKILIAWEIKNNSNSFIRFRIRDLGKIQLIDANSKEIPAVGLAVDHTKRIEGRDYPVIAPGQTMYFPFSVLFFRDPKLGLTLNLKSDPNDQGGWKYTSLKPGNYHINGNYQISKKNDKDGSLAVELETLSKQGFGYDNFWEGIIISDAVDITIQ